MAETKRYYVTTPIYYVNDSPHIGHAYTTLACDVLARFKRLDGYNVHFLTGTDEHGQKVAKSAAAAGMTPQAFTDKVSQNFRDLADFMGYSHDDFIRTTEDRHTRACQDIWQRLLERDQVYLGSYAGWYAVRDEAFYAEDELTTNAEGKKVGPSGAEVEWVEEPSYFFRLSDWGDRLMAYWEENPDSVLPKSRMNEVKSFVKGGLEDISVSRTSFDWGVPIPNDDEHIMYVWLDALINYVTATGYPDLQSDRYKTFWPADLHMVGKDILRFHAVFWPAFLMAADLEPPRRVYAHGWWTNEGEKISKSIGNVIDPIDLVNRYGLDQVRYFLLREVPFGNDGDFSHRAMVGRANSELANDLGNLAQRVLSMVAKNCDGQVPAVDMNAFSGDDQALMESAYSLLPQVREHMDVQTFHEALEAVWRVIRAANAYVDHQAPWKLRKEDPVRMNQVLYTLIESIRQIALVLQPYMPDSCARMLDQLAIPVDRRTFEFMDAAHALVCGTPLPRPEGVFPRLSDEAEDGGDV